MRKNNCFILTGGPGSGKSAVINSLRRKGYMTIEENGRKIIQQQVAVKGDALPWDNLIKFRDLMLQQAIDDYLSVPESINPIFFDRGIIDIFSYSQLIGEVISEQPNNFAQQYEYNKIVFFFPPWEEIYTQDSERKQDYEEAIKTSHIIRMAYSKYYYELVEVPKTDVESRVAFILKTIKSP